MLALLILGIVGLMTCSAVFGYNLSYFYNENNNFRNNFNGFNNNNNNNNNL